MPVSGFIYDTTNQLSSKIDDAEGTEKEGLIVATRPLKTFYNKIFFFSHPTYGIDMNKSLGAVGTPVDIHNGIDNVYWTASAISGALRWDFNSSVEAHTGSYSIDGSSTINGDESQYAKGSNQDLTGYTSLSGWIKITGWPITGTKEVQIYGWDVGVGQVGNIVDIGDYVNTSIFNVWHKFIIPLTDMGLAGKTIDSIRVKTVKLGAGSAPSYYLDDIKIQENELPIEYTIKPTEGTWLRLDLINTVMADTLNTVLADASMYNLSYDKFLGVPELPVGLLYKEYHNDEVTLTAEFHSILDFLQMPNTNRLISGCDGTNAWLNLNQKLAHPILLKSENLDKLSFSIRDDMSGLLRLRMAMAGAEEIR